MSTEGMSVSPGNAFGSLYVFYPSGRCDNTRLDELPTAKDLLRMVGTGYEVRPLMFNNRECVVVFSAENREDKECNVRATKLILQRDLGKHRHSKNCECVRGTALVIDLFKKASTDQRPEATKTALLSQVFKV